MLADRASAHFKSHAGGYAVAWVAVAVLLMVGGCERKTFDDYLKMGDQARRDSKLADAESDYQSAIGLKPDDPHGHLALGDLYNYEQKQGPAQLEFMKVLELDPRNALAHMAMGNLYAAQSQLGMAEAQYRAAIALDPSRPSYHLELASLLVKEGKNADAESEIRTCIGLDPKNAQAHFALANLLSAQPGHEAEAQSEYAQARALDPALVPPGAPAAAAPAGVRKIKPIDKKFLLTHDSPVYESPDSSSPAVANVHHKKFVHVIGITGDWLQIKLRTGVVGFIPIKAAE